MNLQPRFNQSMNRRHEGQMNPASFAVNVSDARIEPPTL